MEHMNRYSLYILHNNNVYANNLVLETAAKMTEEKLSRESSPSHGSVMNLLQHMFGCELVDAVLKVKREPASG